MGRKFEPMLFGSEATHATPATSTSQSWWANRDLDRQTLRKESEKKTGWGRFGEILPQSMVYGPSQWADPKWDKPHRGNNR